MVYLWSPIKTLDVIPEITSIKVCLLHQRWRRDSMTKSRQHSQGIQYIALCIEEIKTGKISRHMQSTTLFCSLRRLCILWWVETFILSAAAEINSPWSWSVIWWSTGSRWINVMVFFFVFNTLLFSIGGIRLLRIWDGPSLCPRKPPYQMV